jgi:hypothetical protein
VWPIRSFTGDSDAFLPIFVESIAVTIFVVGIQSLFFNMLPIAFMDGEKIWTWNKPIWLGMMSIATLLFWHVFLNQNGAYAAAFSNTGSRVALSVLFGGLALSVLAWAFFALRARRERRLMAA